MQNETVIRARRAGNGKSATMASMSCYVVAVTLLAIVHLAVAAAAGAGQQTFPGCPSACGAVDIPYPFGVGANCSRDGFQIDCVGGATPVLAGTGYRVVKLSIAPASEALVELPIGWQCYNAKGKVVNTSMAQVNLNPRGVYRISDEHNKLYALGCNSLAYRQSQKANVAGAPYYYDYYTGCVCYCNSPESAVDGRCAGVGCCSDDIPPGLTDNAVSFDFQQYNHRFYYNFSPCSYSFLVDRDSYTFRRADLRMEFNRTMPVWLDCAIRPNGSSPFTCADAEKNGSSYACKNRNSSCTDASNGPGYTCGCSPGFEGNAYIVGGCTDVDECAYPEKYPPCHGVCHNTEGSYECKCKRAAMEIHWKSRAIPISPIWL